MCDEIEGRVRAACAIRDEMVTWLSPVEEWKKLWEMPVLVPKRQAKPVDSWSSAYDYYMGRLGERLSTSSGYYIGSVRVNDGMYFTDMGRTQPPKPVPMYESMRPPPPPIPYIQHRCDMCGQDLIEGHFRLLNPGVLGLEMYLCEGCGG